jgi:hypothetical protein
MVFSPSLLSTLLSDPSLIFSITLTEDLGSEGVNTLPFTLISWILNSLGIKPKILPSSAKRFTFKTACVILS